MWTYEQLTGRLLHNGSLIGTGYSGHGDGLNNPSMQNVEGIGPLPRGRYTIGARYHHPILGPCTMNLAPAPGNQMFGRSLFRIHGDNPDGNHTASDGCIVLGPSIREAVDACPDRDLTVV